MTTPKKREKQDEKELKKSIKNRFVPRDYTELIKKYKGDEKEEEVLKLYEELTLLYPHETTYQKDKAKYLFNLSRYEEARKTLTDLLEQSPYDADIFELIGDTYSDEKNEEEALIYYMQAKKFQIRTSYGSYNGNTSLEGKIERLEGQKEAKKTNL